MNCSDIAQILDDGDTGRLEDGLRQAAEAHMAICPDCARDWNLHARLVARRMLPVPAALVSDCRALAATATPARSGHRVRGRFVLIGTIAAAAAAATLAMYVANPSAPSVAAAVSVTAEPQERPATAPDTVNSSSGRLAASAVDEPRQETSAPVPLEHMTISVRALPLQNDATDAADKATVDSFHAAMLDQLREVPNLSLIVADQIGADPEERTNYEITITGNRSIQDNKVRVRIQARRSGPGGFVQPISVELNLDCAGVPDCPAVRTIATAVVRSLRATMFPPDPSLLQAQLQDPTQDAELRLKALKDLRSPRPGASEALRDPATVRGVIDLATVATIAAHRAEIWRAMRGVGSPNLVEPLIHSSHVDAASAVRLEAVTTLAADFGGDPRVHAAFEVIARQDPVPLLRALAGRGLSGEDSWRQYVVTSLQDATMSARERIEALMYHTRHTNARGLANLQDLLGDDAISTLAEVLPRAAQSPGRSEVDFMVSQLGAIDHPAITDMLLTSMDRSDEVLDRRVVLNQLTRRGNDTRVRAALEKIAADDPDPELRQMAGRALQENPASRQTRFQQLQ